MTNREAGAPLATFSLVFGLLSIPCFSLPLPALPAVVLGHIALGHFGSAETKNARARAWIGLLLGYSSLAVFGIFAVLFAIGTANTSDDAVPVAVEESPPQNGALTLPSRADGPMCIYSRVTPGTTDSSAARPAITIPNEPGSKTPLALVFRACEVCQPGQPQ